MIIKTSMDVEELLHEFFQTDSSWIPTEIMQKQYVEPVKMSVYAAQFTSRPHRKWEVTVHWHVGTLTVKSKYVFDENGHLFDIDEQHVLATIAI